MIQAANDQEVSYSERLSCFLAEFDLFPLKIERIGLKYWYLLIALPFVGIFVLTLVTGYADTTLIIAHENGIPPETLSSIASTGDRVSLYIKDLFLNDVGFNLAGIGFLLAGYAFVVWQKKIKGLFRFILNTKLIEHPHDKEDLDASLYIYLKEYEEKLKSKYRFVVIIPITILALVPAFTSGNILHPPDGLVGRLWYFSESIRWFFAVLVWAYCVGACGWAIAVTAAFIKKLPGRFKFNFNPGHPDGCGGLKPVGEFCLLMVTPILISILYLALFGILTRMIDSAAMRYITPEHGIVVAFDNLALFVFAIPLAAFVFFNTLWSFHVMMLRERREYENAYSLLIQKCLNEMKSNIERNDVAAAKISSEKLDVIGKMHPDKIGFPVWPFNREILLRFVTPQILSVASSAAPFIKRFFTA